VSLKVMNVIGARPNMMKIAPIVEAMRRHSGIEQILIHTGQHYDEKMSQVFFDELGIPKPDIYLGVGSGSHAEQTAKIMIAFEQILLEQRPDIVLVVGDVNSTMACAITAAKLMVPVGHVEAGLRSYDRAMPEEINRIVTDVLSEFLFTTTREAGENLIKEGISEDKIFFVGNVMIDTLNGHLEQARASNAVSTLGLAAGEYALITLHRPSNVDNRDDLEGILQALLTISRKLPVLFPAHPRTRQRLIEFGLQSQIDQSGNMRLVEPLGYFQFLDLMMNARLVLTDSGGIQEETTVLGIPCLTIRENTERPITITEGTNLLVGTKPEKIVSAAEDIIAGGGKELRIPELWDGQAAERIVKILNKELGS